MQAGKPRRGGPGCRPAIAHELNQPLAAPRTPRATPASSSTRSDHATAQENLGKIIGLVDRMGRITGALKSFARNPSVGQRGTARLAEAVDNALFPETRIAAVAPAIERRHRPASDGGLATRTG